MPYKVVRPIPTRAIVKIKRGQSNFLAKTEKDIVSFIAENFTEDNYYTYCHSNKNLTLAHKYNIIFTLKLNKGG